MPFFIEKYQTKQSCLLFLFCKDEIMRILIKYTFRFALAILVLLLVLPFFLYIPFVQDFAKEKAVSYLEASTPYHYNIEKIRIKFPLRFALQKLLITDAAADTVLYTGELQTQIALLPLLKTSVVVNELKLDEAYVNYTDSAQTMLLNGHLGELFLTAHSINWSTMDAVIPEVVLKDAQIKYVGYKAGTEPDTAVTVLPAWNVNINKLGLLDVTFEMDYIPSNITVKANVPKIELTKGLIDLQKQDITIETGYLEGSECNIFMSSDSVSQAADTINSTAASLPWTIKATKLALTDNRFTYKIGATTDSVVGFNPSDIVLDKISFQADSVFNSGMLVKANISKASFAEKSGLELKELNGRINIDSTRMQIEDLNLKTGYSYLKGNALISSSLFDMKADAAIDYAFKGVVGMQDLFFFAGNPPKDIYNRYHAEAITLNSSARGTLAQLNNITLSAVLPECLDIEGKGAFSKLYDIKQISGSMNLNVKAMDLTFLPALLPDTSMRSQFAIPRNISLNGLVKVSSGNWMGDLVLRLRRGKVALQGMFNPHQEAYSLNASIDTINLKRFLPKDSLGILIAKAEIKGKGFDLQLPNSFVNANVDLVELVNAGHSYKNGTLKAFLKDSVYGVDLNVNDEYINIASSNKGTLSKKRVSLETKTVVQQLNLFKLGLTNKPMGILLGLNGQAQYDFKDHFDVNLDFNNIQFADEKFVHTLGDVALVAHGVHDSIFSKLSSGDLILTTSVDENLQSYLKRSSIVLDKTLAELKNFRLNANMLSESLPHFTLTMKAGNDNVLAKYLRSSKISFKEANVWLVNNTNEGIQGKAYATNMRSGQNIIDSLVLNVNQRTDSLTYSFKMQNLPGGTRKAYLAEALGYWESNAADLLLQYKDASNVKGLDIGLHAQVADSMLSFHLYPANPILAFQTWNLNTGNFIDINTKKQVKADVVFESDGRKASLTTVDSEDGIPQGAIRLTITGIELDRLSKSYAFLPTMSGRVGLGVQLESNLKRMAVDAGIKIDSLIYKSNPVGSLRTNINYLAETNGTPQFSGYLDIDSIRSAVFSGNLASKTENEHYNVKLDRFPLKIINPFLPDETATLSGMLNGGLDVVSHDKRYEFDGDLFFKDAKINVSMINTSFMLDSQNIAITNSIVHFNKFSLIPPNKNLMTMDGTVNLENLENILTDLSIKATDFQVIDVSQKASSMIFGKAYVDLNTTIKGSLAALKIRGNMMLLGNTDVTYVMQNSPLQVNDKTAQLVQFVSFRDTSEVDAIPLLKAQTGGLDLLFTIGINDAAQAGIYLSDDGSNRIEIQGGGNLVYQASPEGSTSFTGRYSVTGGTVVYNPPIISQKVFNIQQGSYVDWTGDMLDPTLHITAVDKIRTSVTDESSGATNPVTFNAIVNVMNTLDNMQITFDLAAPDNSTVQSQLSSMNAEERSKQAMNLLLYNMYSGPGMSSASSQMNATSILTSFVQSQVNDWARNTLKGVDISLGVDTYQEGESGNVSQRTDYTYSFSKQLFNNRFKVKIGGSFSPDAQAQEKAIGQSFIDDVTLEYKLNRQGSAYLTLFHNTSYESILEGQIISTGIGLVYRKRMEMLRDLFFFGRKKDKQQTNEK